jgi:hypothetical protein
VENKCKKKKPKKNLEKNKKKHQKNQKIKNLLWRRRFSQNFQAKDVFFFKEKIMY